jgi:hypothetical protein
MNPLCERCRLSAHEGHCAPDTYMPAHARQIFSTPEDQAEAFIQAALDLSPEPLRRLGEYLARVLDEDQWATAERMLLGAVEQARRAAKPQDQAAAAHE